ncbi:MAG: chromosome segregation protein SMC [Candidatus Kuenenia sp.]|nr:chromosome segregation protein SMC [Candidatus Kuenenia hertensis]
MKLKKLELFGFKSFAEKTEVIFEDGINVIVGPNGCGKSNIVDAVKWVLGEQSVKSLRGNEMSDVIFNGTEKRPSLGYAEVSLTVLNNKGLLPLEYSEVCITRRLYASGESEYLINKQASRLKDIRDLFVDTGFGSNAYSVIEQGNVDALLRANANERRILFEEAAGISRFKLQKKAALSKLEHVEQNLLRVGDIIEELQKQLRSIKLQASKARKYQEYKEQLKKLKVGLSLKNYRELNDKKVSVSEHIKQIEEQKQKLVTIVDNLKLQINEVEDTLEQMGQQSTQLQTEKINLEAQISKDQDKVKYDTDRIEELKTHLERLLEQQKVLENKIGETKNNIVKSKEMLTVLEQDIVTVQDDHQKKEISGKQINLECDMLYQGMEEKKSEVIAILQKESGVQNEIGSLTMEKESLRSRGMRLQKRQDEIASSVNMLKTKYETIMDEKNSLVTEYDNLEKNLSTSKGRIQELINIIRSLEEQINLKKQSQSSKKSRHEVLMDYEVRAEGIESGAKFIVEESKKTDSVLKGIQGMIVDMLKVDLPYARAIEAALGDKVQCIVVDTTQHAIEALAFLQENQKGNAIFFPLDRMLGQSSVNEEILQKPNVIGAANRLVDSRDDVRSVIDGFLSNTVVVEKLDTAIELNSHGPCVRCVTLNGELFESDGTISGGRKQGQVGIISRRSELKKIEDELLQLEADFEKLEKEKHAYGSELGGLEAETAQLAVQIEQLNLLKMSKDNELSQNKQKQEEFLAEEKMNEEELEEINGEIENTQEREISLQERLEALNQHHEVLEQQIEETSMLVKEKEVIKKEIQEEIMSLKVILAQKEEKKDSVAETLNKLSTDQQEMEEQIHGIADEYKNCQQKISDTEREIKDLGQRIEELQSKKIVLDDTAQNLRAEIERNDCHAAELRTSLEENQTEYGRVEQELQESKFKENEYQIRISNLEERIREEYKLEISELHSNQEEVELELSGLKGKQDQSDVSQEEFWEAVSGEIEELQGKVERLGNVNLEAIAEQEELENREGFLLNQKEDLEKSHTSLQNLIKKINHTSREAFEKTFHEVRENFQMMFRKLFGGGKADILLEENVDILEAGIEIVAQPPNKELRSITLLSGGEKVMITVALLFSVFQTKPSPFCILDEVDAALDENNINRFNLIVKEFTRETQFLMITHNKVTMSIADVLYGITMQEPGVSKKIAVKFEEIEKKVA